MLLFCVVDMQSGHMSDLWSTFLQLNAATIPVHTMHSMHRELPCSQNPVLRFSSLVYTGNLGTRPKTESEDLCSSFSFTIASNSLVYVKQYT